MKRSNFVGRLILVMATVALLKNAAADQYHYKNILIGERASGMGGAYLAISDDPSGMYYNPAGLAFSFESYLSLSANAWSSSSLEYENVVPGKNYSLKSSAFVPAFFGFTQNLGKKLKFGFSVIVTDSELLDQQDELADWTTTVGEANYLTRKYFNQDTTYLIGPTFAREIGKNMAAGISLFAQARLNKAIDNQMIAFNPVPSGEYYLQNTYLSSTAFSFVPKLGIQYMPIPKWSIGATVSKVFFVSGTTEIRSISQPISGNNPTDKTGAFEDDFIINEVEGGSSVGEIWNVSLGNAYFFTKKFLMAFDFDFYSGDASANVKATFNWSVGAEYFVGEAFPLRLGVYSNNHNVKDISLSTSNTNLLGASFGIGYVTPGSSFSLGASYAMGSGSGTIVGGQAPKKLAESRLGIFLMGSYQL